ncbi:hypothetical protein GOODEAATRI_031350, partial [Goodea atripinnis]
PSTPIVPVHLPGTGRFIPPQECKLKFPFKSNPAHRLSWGPASEALQALASFSEDMRLIFPISPERCIVNSCKPKNTLCGDSCRPQRVWHILGGGVGCFYLTGEQGRGSMTQTKQCFVLVAPKSIKFLP